MKKHLEILVSFAFFVASCSNTETSNNKFTTRLTSPTEYIMGVSEVLVDTPCITIDGEPFWFEEDVKNEIHNSIVDTAKLTINGKIIDIDRFISYDSFMHVLDDNGNIIGSYGGPTAVCFSVEDLVIGLNHSSIEFESPSGSAYSFQWITKLDSDEGISFSEESQ